MHMEINKCVCKCKNTYSIINMHIIKYLSYILCRYKIKGTDSVLEKKNIIGPKALIFGREM